MQFGSAPCVIPSDGGLGLGSGLTSVQFLKSLVYRIGLDPCMPSLGVSPGSNK